MKTYQSILAASAMALGLAACSTTGSTGTTGANDIPGGSTAASPATTPGNVDNATNSGAQGTSSGGTTGSMGATSGGAPASGTNTR